MNNNLLNARKKWCKEDDDKLINLCKEKISIEQISKELNRSKRAIETRISKNKNNKIVILEDNPTLNNNKVQPNLYQDQYITVPSKKINKLSEDEFDEKNYDEISISKDLSTYEICDCNFDSQVAYIKNSVNEFPEKTITIIDYLKNPEIQNDVLQNNKFLCCSYDNELEKYRSDIKISHFRHKKHIFNNNNEMTKWHKNWQNIFSPNIEIIIGNRRADAVINNVVLEFQHSRISKKLVEERNINYKTNNKTLYWIINCSNCIDIHSYETGRYKLTFKTDCWKYENFIDCEYIFLDHNEKIFRIKPKLVKSKKIEINEYKSKNEFIESLKNNTNIWTNDELEQCTLYFNQRGAGCGKTYESIQLMDKDIRFKDKNTFIFLTKMHSAKEVIFNELKEQSERGVLSNLIMDDGFDDINRGKQYKIEYFNSNTKQKCKIIIGTIDSFMCAIGNKEIRDKDYFTAIVKSIRDGKLNTTKSGSIKYAQQNTQLNKECLVIIDEAQDLPPYYIEAIGKIMRTTYIDTYIIGDKLQSIQNEHNIHTFIEKEDLPTIKIIRDKGINHVMRFHNTKFIDFVNKIIPFNKKYELPEITQICNNKNCKYKHENELSPYKIFELPLILANDTDEDKINNAIEKIINYIKNEIMQYNYLPNNFMFIFPILKNNVFASRLETRLQDFWILQFKNKEYRTNVLLKNEFWKNKLNDKFYKYVYLHKSEEGKSIDLRESENSTRILSIHASKGNGCEVVFLLGLDEMSLCKFSKKKNNLIYHSLLHVAITRQKKKLYIGLVRNKDDIYNKFNDFDIEIDKNILPNIGGITNSIKYDKIKDFCSENDEIFGLIDKTYIENKNYDKFIPTNDENKNIIDWGHHLIRKYIFFYGIISNIINNDTLENNNIKNQILAIVRGISELQIKTHMYAEYYNELNQINKNIKLKKRVYILPILKFDTGENSQYTKYKDILLNFISNIQEKIKYR